MKTRLPLLLVLLAVLTPVAPARADTVPYTDPNAHGSIGLCDDQGHQVTSGSLSSAPFVWKAVATVPAPDGYGDAQATTTLYYVQPRQQVDPSQWNPAQLTASSHFSDPDHPVAQSTYADQGLLPFTQQYPPTWDGFVQLRMYFAAINKVGYRRTYPALDLRVTGDRWQVVGPVTTVECGAAKGRSMETDQLPAARLASPAPHGAGSGASASAGSGAAAGAGGTPTAAGGARARRPGTADALDGTGRSRSSTWTVAGLLVLGAAGLGGGVWAVRRTRA